LVRRAEAQIFIPSPTRPVDGSDAHPQGVAAQRPYGRSCMIQRPSGMPWKLHTGQRSGSRSLSCSWSQRGHRNTITGAFRCASAMTSFPQAVAVQTDGGHFTRAGDCASRGAQGETEKF